MKIQSEHYAFMKTQMQNVTCFIPDLTRKIAADIRCKDREMRLRWDLMYAAGISAWVCSNLYSYCNDDHIDTALRQIMREIHA